MRIKADQNGLMVQAQESGDGEIGLQVTVKLYGRHRSRRPASAAGEPHHPFAVQLPVHSNIGDLIAQLGLDKNFISAVAVNGEATTQKGLLHDGDVVRFFAPVAGG